MGPDDTVLDIGVGTGYSAFIFAERAREVVGLDIAEPLIEFLAGLPARSNLRFIAGDACAPAAALLKSYAGHFSRIYAADVLEHVPDPGALFKTVASLLKPGGLALVTFPNDPTHGISYFASGAALRVLLAAANLRVVRFDVVTSPRWIRAVRALCVTWPLALHRRLRTRPKTPGLQPQKYDDTYSFAFNLQMPWYRIVINAYFEAVMGLAKRGPLFHFAPADEDIAGCRVLLILTREDPPLDGKTNVKAG